MEKLVLARKASPKIGLGLDFLAFFQAYCGQLHSGFLKVGQISRHKLERERDSLAPHFMKNTKVFCLVGTLFWGASLLGSCNGHQMLSVTQEDSVKGGSGCYEQFDMGLGQVFFSPDSEGPCHISHCKIALHECRDSKEKLEETLSQCGSGLRVVEGESWISDSSPLEGAVLQMQTQIQEQGQRLGEIISAGNRNLEECNVQRDVLGDQLSALRRDYGALDEQCKESKNACRSRVDALEMNLTESQGSIADLESKLKKAGKKHEDLQGKYDACINISRLSADQAIRGLEGSPWNFGSLLGLPSIENGQINHLGMGTGVCTAAVLVAGGVLWGRHKVVSRALRAEAQRDDAEAAKVAIQGQYATEEAARKEAESGKAVAEAEVLRLQASLRAAEIASAGSRTRTRNNDIG